MTEDNGGDVLRVLTVCGVGMGSSLMLRMTAEKALRDLGVPARVEATDVSSARGMTADVIIGQGMHTDELAGRAEIVLAISNFMDSAALQTQLEAGVPRSRVAPVSLRQQAPVLRALVAVAAADWRAAVRAACAPLVEAGALEPRYAERCIAMVEQHGPYIVLAPGLALAHARPEDGVLRLCVSAAVLSQPVAFGHPDNDPVDVVFAFGSPDSDQHVGLLAALANHLQTGLDQRLRSSADNAAAERELAGLANDVEG